MTDKIVEKKMTWSLDCAAIALQVTLNPSPALFLLLPMPTKSTKKTFPADTQPKLRVVAHNARLDEALQTEISGQLASVLKTNPKLTTHQAMWTVQERILANNPWEPLKNGKCPINDLPNEILAYIFSIGVLQEQEGDDSEYEDEDEMEDDEWEDMDTDGEFNDDESESSSLLAAGGSPAESDSDDDDSDLEEDDDDDSDDEPSVPFQILVSHVCHRWREVALESHILWTTLVFANRLRLKQARMYIDRSGGLPLNILIDCTFPPTVDEEDHPDHPLYHENKKKSALVADHGDDSTSGTDEMDDGSDDGDDIWFLSQKELAQILDLIEPEVSHWGVFQFHASTYGYFHLLMSRLHNLPSAPLLETFEVCHYEDCEDYEVFNGDDKTSFLPFHGNAPMLKEAVFWGVHIDWDAALPSFLRGLLLLELSYHSKDVRPSYKTFTQIIENSPDLHTLTLSLSGPALANGLPYNTDLEEGGWGKTPLTILSLKELALQFHDPKYASALVNHLDAPNVTSLLLNFEEEDYSEFVGALVKPVKGRAENILTHIEHMKISGLPCSVYSAEALLGQLGKLKSLNIKVVGPEENIIFQKLADPYAGRLPTTPGTNADADAEAPQQQQQQAPATAVPHTVEPPSASSSSPTFSIPTSNTPLPALFCPRLEAIVTHNVAGIQIKKLVLARRKLGVPLKRVSMSQLDPVSAKEERWIKANVEQFDFFVPSDSEEESETDTDTDSVVEDGNVGDDGDDDEEDDDDDDDDDDEDDEEDDEEEDANENETPQTALFSPLARHLGRGRRGRQRRSMDLD